MARSAQLARLRQRLDAIPREVRAAVEPVLKQAGDELVSRMRQLAPVDSGGLRDSIVATPAGQTTPPYSQPGGSTVVPELSVMVTAGNEDVRYPHLQEYGTADTPAQPFFWPAFRLSRAKLAGKIKRAISKAVKTAGTRT